MARPSALRRFLSVIGIREADISHDERRQAVGDSLNDGRDGSDPEKPYRYVRDMFDDEVVYGEGNDLYRAGYVIGDDGDAEIAPEPHQKVRQRYEPVPDAGTQDKTEAAYPWDKCISDNEGKYGKEGAAKVCGAIKAKNESVKPTPAQVEEIAHELGVAPLREDHQGDFARMSHDDKLAHLRDDHDADGDDMASHDGEELQREHDAMHTEMHSDAARAAAANLVEFAESAGALVGDIQRIEEKALARDGTFETKIIAPGWGSSGYYSPQVLKRDGPKVFPPGTHMYVDHPTESQDRERPERSVRDLGGVIVTTPEYREASWGGPGLYAKAQAIGEMSEMLDTIAPHIGVSIRASGRVSEGEAEGKQGNIVEELVQGHSIDYVTRAGAGGTIRSVMESARQRIREASARVTSAGVSNTTTAEGDKGMADKTLTEALAEIESLRTSNTRLAAANAIRDARDFAVAELRSVTAIPDLMKARMVETLSANPPMKDGALDGAAFKTVVENAIKTETEFWARLSKSGEVRGLGESTATTAIGEIKAEDRDKRMKEALAGMGLSGAVLEGAAKGRLM